MIQLDYSPFLVLSAEEYDKILRSAMSLRHFDGTFEISLFLVIIQRDWNLVQLLRLQH